MKLQQEKQLMTQHVEEGRKINAAKVRRSEMGAARRRENRNYELRRQENIKVLWKELK